MIEVYDATTDDVIGYWLGTTSIKYGNVDLPKRDQIAADGRIEQVTLTIGHRAFVGGGGWRMVLVAPDSESMCGVVGFIRAASPDNQAPLKRKTPRTEARGAGGE